MDHILSKERDFEVDLENGAKASVEDQSKDSTSGLKIQAKQLFAKICGIFYDGTMNGEEGLKLCCDASGQANLDGGKTISNVENQVVKEKRKKTSNKKASKPPRPPRGPSLDAADLMLIKEITELAMLKRARIERIKALKKMKAAKASSSNSNMFAMAFTILFFLVIIFQGMSSRVTSAKIKGSPLSTETIQSSLKYFGNPSASVPNGPASESPNSVNPIAGSNPPENPRRAVE